MRYEAEINNIVNKVASVQYEIEALTEKAYQDAIEYERERIRFAIVQYALDNNLSIESIEPFINIVNCKCFFTILALKSSNFFS